ncbi:MAG: NAD(P)-binding protein [Candidatus Omnitrophica bacterium]|nr:NAD(P)-binding protein [Candidatus Omnitrophota bacterium]
MKNTELAIIGGGIAGVSSAVYAQRAGLECALFEANTIGGQLLWMETVDNYVGVDAGIRGLQLAESLKKNIQDLEIPFFPHAVKAVTPEEDSFVLTTDKGPVQTRGIVVATGARFRTLGVPGEEELTGKGVSYCAVCDGFFFRKKKVLVVGGGNTAVEEALYLAQFAGQVTLVHRRDRLRAMRSLQEKLFSQENVEILYSRTVEEIQGEGAVNGALLKHAETGENEVLPADGIFVAIGVTPVTELVRGLVDTDKGGFILTDQEMATSRTHIWSCGDCRKRPLRQLITAASEGAIAALSVYRSLRGGYISS